MTLCFVGSSNPELFATRFAHPGLGLGLERRCLRGTMLWGEAGPAELRSGTFQWTAAVKAFSLLTLRTLA
ncbi:hypothetical protein EO238_29300, partial [Citrobacter sp. AAK_AS5]